MKKYMIGFFSVLFLITGCLIAGYQVSYNNLLEKEKAIELTKNEFKILWFLIKGKGKILSRTVILEYLWDNEMFVDDNTLSVNIRRIRAKLEKIGIYNYIHTKHGQGYSV